MLMVVNMPKYWQSMNIYLLNWSVCVHTHSCACWEREVVQFAFQKDSQDKNSMSEVKLGVMMSQSKYGE